MSKDIGFHIVIYHEKLQKAKKYAPIIAVIAGIFCSLGVGAVVDDRPSGNRLLAGGAVVGAIRLGRDNHFMGGANGRG